ncbi:MAG: phosphate ABC transporter substrate-binding protein PstS family protein [Rhodospirillaceae bacterium]|nr:phosphate ABC transporter substrate-binding protein PstS family protein [Rhodospirillaceae bacterium]
MFHKFAGALALAGSFAAFSAYAVDVDPALPSYTKQAGVEGSLKSVGSDTLNNLMALWAESFAKEYPSVKIEIEGKGSGTAPPALISGTAQFGPMSRPMKGGETDDFEKKYGYKPVGMRVAVDALAVFVHKDNPVKCLSLAQVDAMFSKTRKKGGKEDIKTWGQVGVTGEWASKPVSLYGRNSASGTYGYFKEVALGDGDYKDSVKEQPGSSAVVQGIASDKYAIGYSGVGYKTADVKTVPLSAKDGGTCFDANSDNAYAGDYPITRFLYVYVNRKPGAKMDPLRAEFAKFVLSKQGQMGTIKDGFYPIPAAVASQDLKSLGVE